MSIIATRNNASGLHKILHRKTLNKDRRGFCEKLFKVICSSEWKNPLSLGIKISFYTLSFLFKFTQKWVNGVGFFPTLMGAF
jgi:hypothetical protein